MLLNLTFKSYSVSDGEFYWWRAPEYPDKTSDLSQVTDKPYHIKLYLEDFVMSGTLTYNLIVVVGTDCIGRKSNYNTITATTSLYLRWRY